MSARRARQPLNYQIQNSDCWPTSVANALIYLFDDQENIPLFVMRLLDAVSDEEGVGGGAYKRPEDWAIVIKAIESRCRIEATSFPREDLAGGPRDVPSKLNDVDFSQSVVICDINAGTHSVLLVDCDEDRFYGFDPSWPTVANARAHPHYETFPDARLDQSAGATPMSHRGRVNFAVDKAHLYAEKFIQGRPYTMGAVSARHITILRKIDPK